MYYLSKANEYYREFVKYDFITCLHLGIEEDAYVINHFDSNDHKLYITELNLYLKNIEKLYKNALEEHPNEQIVIYLNEIFNMLKNEKHLVKCPEYKFYTLCPINNILSKYYEYIISKEITFGDDITYEKFKENIKKMINIYKSFEYDFVKYKNSNLSVKMCESIISNMKNLLKNNHFNLDKKHFADNNDYKDYNNNLLKLINNVIWRYVHFIENDYMLYIKKNPIKTDLALHNSNNIFELAFKYHNMGHNHKIIKLIKKSLKNLVVLSALANYYCETTDDVIKATTRERFIDNINYESRSQKYNNNLFKNILTLNNNPQEILKIIKQITPIVKKNLIKPREVMFNKNNMFDDINKVVYRNEFLYTFMKLYLNKNSFYKFHSRPEFEFKLTPEVAQPFSASAYQIGPFIDFNNDYKIINENIYYINPRALDSFRKNEALTLFAHEAYPGHCLERSLTINNNNIPLHLKFSNYGNGFSEGWATYVEDFILDVNPTREDIIGKINYDLFRTARVIVEYFINYNPIFNYDDAVNFMKDFTLMEKNDIDYEIIRYASLPGQSLTYMFGKWQIENIVKLFPKEVGILKKILNFGPINFNIIENKLTDPNGNKVKRGRGYFVRKKKEDK